MQIGNWKIIAILALLILFTLILDFFDFNLGIYQQGELSTLQIIITAVLLVLLGHFRYYLWIYQTEEDMQRQKRQSKVTIFAGILLLIIGIFDPFDFFSAMELSYPEIFLLRIAPGLLVTISGFYDFLEKV